MRIGNMFEGAFVAIGAAKIFFRVAVGCVMVDVFVDVAGLVLVEELRVLVVNDDAGIVLQEQTVAGAATGSVVAGTGISSVLNG